jgi:hypothetical protein
LIGFHHSIGSFRHGRFYPGAVFSVSALGHKEPSAPLNLLIGFAKNHTENRGKLFLDVPYHSREKLKTQAFPPLSNEKNICRNEKNGISVQSVQLFTEKHYAILRNEKRKI